MSLPDLFGAGQPTTGSTLPDIFGAAPASGGPLPDLFGGEAPTADLGTEDADGSGLFGFLGNVGEEVQDMAQGITSLIGAGLHDTVNLVSEGLTLGGAETDGFKLDDIATALPGALAKDYDTRYGISKFAEGDIWGGLKAIFTGLYERPLSAIGDALMVGTAAKVGAKAGMLGAVDDASRAAVAAGEAAPTLGQRILGPGKMEAISLTGADTGAQALQLSQNPVARLGQKKLYDLITYGEGLSDRVAGRIGLSATPEQYIGRLSDTGDIVRARTNLARAGETPVLRAAASKFFETRGVATGLSLLGMSVGDHAGEASKLIRDLFDPRNEKGAALLGADGLPLVDNDLAVSGVHGTKAVALPDQIPSNDPAVGFLPEDELLDVPEVIMPATPLDETSAPYLNSLVDEFGGDLIPIEPSMRQQPSAPHDFSTDVRSNRVVIMVADQADAPTVARRAAQATGLNVAGRKNYFVDVSPDGGASYDGSHYNLVNEDGSVVFDISVATPELFQAQKAWSHMALQAQAKIDEIAAAKAELAASQGMSPDREMELTRVIEEASEELAAIQAFNATTFDFMRRTLNGGDYNPTLSAIDRARNVVYNYATRDEINHGLTFRKAMDRAYLTLRGEKWSAMMRNVEEGLTATIVRGLEAGAKKEDLINPIIAHVESVFGANNPWTELMFRSYVDEVIPFETSYTVGGKAAPVAAAAKAAPDRPVIPPVPDEVGDAAVWARSFDDDVVADATAHPGAFSDVDKSIALHKKLGITEPWNKWEWPRRLAEHRLDDAAGGAVRAQSDDIPDMAPEPTPAPLEGERTATFQGRLATGEKTILSDGRALRAKRGYFDEEGEWVDIPLAEQAAEMARRLTNRLRGETRMALVENGEFPGFSWREMMREQTQAGLPIPQYYPHIRASKATGDVVMGNQHERNVRSVIESETSRMKKNSLELWEQGLIERDPIKAYEQLFSQIQTHVEFRDFMTTMVQKYGRRPAARELDAWDTRAQGEVLVSMNGLNGHVNQRVQFMQMKHDSIMSGMTPEDATMNALETIQQMALDSWQAGIATDEIWALPRHVASMLKKAQRNANLAPKFNFYYDSAMGLWKSAALSLSPRWIVNNTLGNLVYMAVHNPSAIRYFIGQLMPKSAARAKAFLGENYDNMIHRDFMHGEMRLLARDRMAVRADRAGIEAGVRLAQSPVQSSLPVRALRRVSRGGRDINTYIEGAARRGVALSELRKAHIRRVGGRFVSTKRLLEEVASDGLPTRTRFDRVITEVNATLGDYLTMTPFESQIVRRYIMPFYAFYRHTARFVARMPFEHPFKMRVLEMITELDRQMNPYMPEYMLGAANMGGLFMRFGGANPLEAVTQTYAPQVTHPLLGLAIQRATGTNPFGQPWIVPTGATVQTGGGNNYAIMRGPDGSVIGVRPMEGMWAPPLYESLMSIVPQAGLVFDPFERAAYKRAIGMFGLSISNYNPEEAAFYGAANELQALQRAVRTLPEA